MKKAIGILLAVCMGVTMLAAAAPGAGAFSDVPEGAVYDQALTELAEICALGYGDGTFRPEALITRAEFVAMLLKLLGKADLTTAKRDQIFVDVPVSYWANQYITVAFDAGLVNGRGGGIFQPGDNVTYEEAVKIVVCHLLDGRVGGISFPEGYLNIAQEWEIGQIQSGAGQQLKRWQTALLIYQALHADQARIDLVKETYAAGRSDGGTKATSDVLWAAAPPLGTPEEGSSSSDWDSIADETAPMSPSAPASGGKVPATPLPEVIDGGALIVEPAPPSGQQITAGLLTAGEWNDNANWDFWNKLMANRDWHTLQSRWQISTDRYIVSVTDGGAPVIGAKVVLSQQGDALWTAVTDNRGNAVIFAAATDAQSTAFTLEVITSEDTLTIDPVVLTDNAPYAVEIRQGAVQNSIDVMFMIDTTGSMGDELQYIKEELSDVVGRISCDVRVSCNFYRDIGDEYIVRPFAFTTDVDEAVTQISGQRASGGGDYPEAVELALANAIDEHSWNPEAKERLLFLVLDAPPHYDTDRVAQINACLKRAAALGIRVIPIASSGVDKETEFLLRSMGIVTNGTYVFLTDHSGIGNSHIEPTIGPYTVEFLNDLIVNIINGRL